MLWHFITQRKTENILYGLTLTVCLVSYSSIFSYISFNTNLVFIVIVSASVFLYIKNISLPVWIINMISIGLIVMPFLSCSPEDILLPSIEALTMILSVRFLGRKTSREYFQIYLLSVLLLGSSSLFDISWIFFLRLLLMLILTIFAILLLTYMKETKEEFMSGKKLLNFLKLATFISIASIPLSAMFFFVLPRTPVPLVDIGFNRAKTGFSSAVNLGSVREIEEDRTVVMRVKMDKLPQELYWRTITFDTFDGKRWEKTVFKGFRSDIYGEKIYYTVSLEPVTEQYLPVLDYPSNVYMKNVFYEYPGDYKTVFPIEKKIKYTAVSFINPCVEESQPHSIYLYIPQNISEKIKNLARKIAEGSSNKEEIAEKILKFLKGYKYSLKNLPAGNNPLEDFLFNKKSGNCEYFATTMALMLRINGIPSRVVGGFKGGIFNSLGGYYIVRASDAHLWVEAYINGRWLRFDPSGKITPLHEPVIFYFIDYLWNSIVIDYDFKAQIKLAKSIKLPGIGFDRKILLIPLFFAIVFSFFKIYQYLKERKNPLYRFQYIMKKYGFERKKNQGLEEFVHTLKDTALKEKVERFVRVYEEIYFKDKEFTKEDLRKLKNLLRDLNESFKSR